jgi:CheY-like chemotaxis protein
MNLPSGGPALRPIELFVPEDTPADLEWLRHVLDQIGLQYHLTVASDGEEAKHLLMKSGKYADAPEPDLILMNIEDAEVGRPEVLNGVPGPEKMPICSPEKKYLVDEIPRHRHFSYLMKPVDGEKLLSCFRSHAHLKALVEQVSRGR